jgi:hypothetical protein
MISLLGSHYEASAGNIAHQLIVFGNSGLFHFEKSPFKNAEMNRFSFTHDRLTRRQVGLSVSYHKSIGKARGCIKFCQQRLIFSAFHKYSARFLLKLPCPKATQKTGETNDKRSPRPYVSRNVRDISCTGRAAPPTA